MKTPKKSLTLKQNMDMEKISDDGKTPIKHKMSFRSSNLPSRKRMRKSECNLDKNGSQSLFDLAASDSSGANEYSFRQFDPNIDSTNLKGMSPSPRRVPKKEKREKGGSKRQ